MSTIGSQLITADLGMRMSGSTTRCVRLAIGAMRVAVNTPMSSASSRKETRHQPAQTRIVQDLAQRRLQYGFLQQHHVVRGGERRQIALPAESPCLCMFHSRTLNGRRSSASAT